MMTVPMYHNTINYRGTWKTEPKTKADRNNHTTNSTYGNGFIKSIAGWRNSFSPLRKRTKLSTKPSWREFFSTA